MSEDERLDRLARATERIMPRAGFVDAVMSAVAEAEYWWTGLPRVARRVLPVLAIAAVVALVLAYRSTRDLDDAATSSVSSVEIEW